MNRHSITTRAITSWAKPWPVAFRSRYTWRLELLPMSKVRRLRCWWKNEAETAYPTVATAFKRIEKDDWLGLRHPIRSYARSGQAEKRPVIFVLLRHGHMTIVDGNHTAMALCKLRHKGHVLAAIGTTKRKPRKPKARP